jgi:hypothetical protein
MVVVTMWYLRQDGKHVTSTLKKSNALDNFDLAKRCKHKKNTDACIHAISCTSVLFDPCANLPFFQPPPFLGHASGFAWGREESGINGRITSSSNPSALLMRMLCRGKIMKYIW